LVFLLVLAAACKTPGGSGISASRRDSLGVEIVENAGAAWPAGLGWSLSAAPLVTIGVEEGDSNYVLDRVVAAVRLSDGRIVVANGLSNQLRYFDTAGRFLRTVGRKGQGPGEFNGLSWVGRLGGDSLLVWDRANARVSVVGPDGTFVRSFPIRRPGPASLTMSPTVLELLPGGELLASVRSATPPSPGLSRDSTLYLRYGLDGLPADTIGRFPDREYYTEMSRRADGVVAGISRSPVPFTVAPSVAAAPEGLYFGVGATYEIGLYSGNGALKRIIRVARPSVPLTADRIAEYRAQRLAAAPNEEVRRFQERALEQMPFPQRAPAYSGFVVDEERNLWVLDYASRGDSVRQLTVFNPKGALLGAVRTPERFRPTQIGADFVLGVWWGPDDVQDVRMYGLIKPEGR